MKYIDNSQLKSAAWTAGLVGGTTLLGGGLIQSVLSTVPVVSGFLTASVAATAAFLGVTAWNTLKKFI